MTRSKWLCGLSVAMGIVAQQAGSTLAQPPAMHPPTAMPQQQQNPAGRPGREQLPQPVYRVAQQVPAAAAVAATSSPNPGLPAGSEMPPVQAEHPLIPALQMAYGAMNHIRSDVQDYSCTLVKRERIDGKLNDQEFIHLRVRHEPFSVYMYFLGPEKLRGQEVLYVAGKNNGNLLGHAGSGIRKAVGTVPLAPTGMLAMQGQRYPITEIGFLNLTRRLIEVAEHDKGFGECDVQFSRGAKINGRVCTMITVLHPVPRKTFKFNKAHVFVDNELNIPVRYAAWDWPEAQGGQPLLLEEYTYTDIKVNNGFTDLDFDDKNPKYHFH